MFKKKPTIKPAAPLRSSDRRKLADRIIQEYQLNYEKATPEETTVAHTSLRNSLLPDNAQSARFTQSTGPDLKQVSGFLYLGGEDARVLWFEYEKRLYPTVYTLWRNPDIVALLHTPEIVVGKLRGGADLMQPGLAGGPPFPERAKKDAVVAVASTSSPTVPVAVGVCEIDVSALGSVQGTKGRAVETLHWEGDELWGYSLGGKPGQVAPGELEGWMAGLSVEGQSTIGKDTAEEGKQLNGGVAQADAETGEGEGGVSLKPEEDIKEWTQKEVDQTFRLAFLFGVHHQKTTHPGETHFGLVFPLSQSFVQSNLVNPFLPIFSDHDKAQLQMKKTSWKNIKKFIKSLDKEKLVKSKEKDGHETVILDVDFDDAAFVEFRPYRLPKKEATTTIKTSEPMDGTDDSVNQKIQINSYYRPTSKLQPLLTRQLYTATEVREEISSYVDSENLVSEENRRLVKLDPTLANSVFDGTRSLDREVLAKGVAPRDAIVERALRAMNASYSISRNNEESKVKAGSPPKVHITLETRSGNKTVTRTSGLEVYFIDPKAFADELRKSVAASTSVEPLAGATKKHEKEVMEVMVQGPQKDAVVKALAKRGVDKRWIEVNDKTKKKK